MIILLDKDTNKSSIFSETMLYITFLFIYFTVGSGLFQACVQIKHLLTLYFILCVEAVLLCLISLIFLNEISAIRVTLSRNLH